jgi:hypothetical protein
MVLRDNRRMDRKRVAGEISFPTLVMPSQSILSIFVSVFLWLLWFPRQELLFD